MMKDIERIDLSGFTHTGEGFNGLSYNSISDPDVMVKMYNAGYDTSMVFTELDVARKVYNLGIPSPEPGRIVTDGERLGIIFRRISPKRSFARAISQEPERYDEYAREFARYCKRLHEFECPPGMFPDAREDFLRMLGHSGLFSKRQKGGIERFIREGVPQCSTALHGDMHVGNILTTLPEGAPMDTPHKVYFIDLGYFSYGCPLIDLGMMGNIGLRSDDSFLVSNLHFDHHTALNVWNSFTDEYFFSSEELGRKWFGPSVSRDSISGLLAPYMLLKLLLVEYNAGAMPESYVDFALDTADSLV